MKILSLSTDERDQYFLDNILTVDDFDRLAEAIFFNIPTVNKRKKKKTITYYNIASAFDIETTSLYKRTLSIYPKDDKDKSKTAFTYIWQTMINGYIIMGRTWKEFARLIDIIHRELKTDDTHRFVFYVHNLSYEFQFMRKYFEIEDLFAVDSRRPIRFHIKGVEFRDSLILSGYSLANLYKDLQHEIHKKEGDLDYKLIRHSTTRMTDNELLYCIYDVFVVSVYIWEKLERGEDLAKIPYTKTGYVREACQNATIKGKRQRKYKSIMSDLKLSVNEYKMLRKTYQGGFTHANAMYVDDVLNNVASYDFTSSYPTVLISEKYPMSRGKRVTLDKSNRSDEPAAELLKRLSTKNYAYMVQIAFTGIKSKIRQDCYISSSKCEVLKNATVDNGRIYKADALVTNITDIDYEIICKAYEWDTMEISNLYIYEYGYLPTDLVETILNFYVDKTTLKDVEEKAVEYGISKGMLNAIYGMMCQNPLQPVNEYDGEWHEVPIDFEEGIQEYNENRKRCTFYPWGVWCCAWARRNLWSAIFELGDDYVYSDTDSVKLLNYLKHAGYFEKYNREIIKKLEKAMKHHGLPIDMIRPKTIKGIEKPLGVWDFEGVYDKFKTLGAKRYLVETDGKLKQTIAGLSKKIGIQYIEEQEDPWEFFSAGDKEHAMKIPAERTGKNLLTYIDIEDSGRCVDYTGKAGEYEARSGIHMEATPFSMSLSDQFLAFIAGIKQKHI